MDFQQLQIFLAAASLKSFSRAAEQLYLSQPGVSGRIKSLEEELGVLLFDRSRSRELVLTEQGRRFQDYAQQLLNLKEEALEMVSGEKEPVSGILQIGASTVPGTYLLPGWLGDFNRLYPGVWIELSILDTAAVLDGIMEYRFDLGLVGSRADGEERLDFHPVAGDELLAAAPPGLFGAGRAAVSLAECLPHRLILRESGSATRSLLEKSLKTKGLTTGDFNGVLQLNSLEASKQGVRCGLGIAFLSRCSIADYMAMGWVEGFAVTDLALSRSIYLVRHRTRVPGRAARLFCNFVQAKGDLIGSSP